MCDVKKSIFIQLPVPYSAWAFLTILSLMGLLYTKSHYPEKASALDFKDATTPIFGQSDVVFDLIYIETQFCIQLPSSNFQNF